VTKLAIINPRTGEQSSIELQLGELAIRRAKNDLAVSKFVSSLGRISPRVGCFSARGSGPPKHKEINQWLVISSV
jgi:hypothetical protein